MKLKLMFVIVLFAVPSLARAQKNATLDEQKKCDTQASKVYHEGRARDGYHGEDSSGLNGYTSHFDPATNICFVWVRYGKMDGENVTFADTISDAFEGRLYASYLWFNPGKPAVEVEPTNCLVK